MALNKSLQQTFRKDLLNIGAGYRAFFAPYNISLGSAQADTTQGPKILDLQTLGPINTDTPPTGWVDLGWIKDLTPAPQSNIGKVRSGYRGAVRAIYRGLVGETLDFKFRESTRMAYKIATGTQIFNLLSSPATVTSGPLSGTGQPAVSMLAYAASGSVGLLTVASASGFTVGQYVVADKDYDGSSYGLIGENATPVFQGMVTDTNYIRKTSDFIGRITAINGQVLTIDQPFTGGGCGNPTGNTVPQTGSKVQVITGWVAREGGSYITEWSAFFVMQMMDLGQILLYYPHLTLSNFKGMPTWDLENAGTTDLKGYELDTSMEAMAFDDPIDGETVVGYKAFYPGPGKNIAY